jgi:hypothetical protein
MESGTAGIFVTGAFNVAGEVWAGERYNMIR